MRRVECPACGKQVQSWILNMHLDSDCTALHATKNSSSIAKNRKSAGQPKRRSVLSASGQQNILRVFSSSTAGKRKFGEVGDQYDGKNTTGWGAHNTPPASPAAPAGQGSNLHDHEHKDIIEPYWSEHPSQEKSKKSEAAMRGAHIDVLALCPADRNLETREKQRSAIKVSQQLSTISTSHQKLHEQYRIASQSMGSMQNEPQLLSKQRLCVPPATHTVHEQQHSAMTVSKQPSAALHSHQKPYEQQSIDCRCMAASQDEQDPFSQKPGCIPHATHVVHGTEALQDHLVQNKELQQWRMTVYEPGVRHVDNASGEQRSVVTQGQLPSLGHGSSHSEEENRISAPNGASESVPNSEPSSAPASAGNSAFRARPPTASTQQPTCPPAHRPIVHPQVNAPRIEPNGLQSNEDSVSEHPGDRFHGSEIYTPDGQGTESGVSQHPSSRFQRRETCTPDRRQAFQIQGAELSYAPATGQACQIQGAQQIVVAFNQCQESTPVQSTDQQSHETVQQIPSAANFSCQRDSRSHQQVVRGTSSEVGQAANQRVQHVKERAPPKRQSQLALGRKGNKGIPSSPFAVLQAPAREVGTTTVEGQYVVENFISPDEEAALLAVVDTTTPPWRPSRVNGPVWGKRWGVQTDLAARKVTAAALELPPELRMVADRMRQVIPQLADFFPNEANAILYRRARGDYLLPHVDDRQLSKGPIVTLSLQGRVYMTLSQEHAGQHLRRFMEGHGGRSPPDHPPACKHLEDSVPEAEASMKVTPDGCNPVSAAIVQHGIENGENSENSAFHPQQIKTGIPVVQNTVTEEMQQQQQHAPNYIQSQRHKHTEKKNSSNRSSIGCSSDSSRKHGNRSSRNGGGGSGMHNVVLLRPRALQLLTGRSRFNFTHGICSNHVVDERRVSITFRYSPLKPV